MQAALAKGNSGKALQAVSHLVGPTNSPPHRARFDCLAGPSCPLTRPGQVSRSGHGVSRPGHGTPPVDRGGRADRCPDTVRDGRAGRGGRASGCCWRRPSGPPEGSQGPRAWRYTRHNPLPAPLDMDSKTAPQVRGRSDREAFPLADSGRETGPQLPASRTDRQPRPPSSAGHRYKASPALEHKGNQGRPSIMCTTGARESRGGRCVVGAMDPYTANRILPGGLPCRGKPRQWPRPEPRSISHATVYCCGCTHART